MTLGVMPHQSQTFASKVQKYTEQLREGDIHSLSGLFDITGARLLRYATGIVGNQHDGEDIVQLVLTKLATNHHVIVDRTCAWAYLLRMTRNEAIDFLRCRERYVTTHQLARSQSLTPSKTKSGDEAKQQLWCAINRLPRKQREVLLLKIWEQMTFEELAGVLDISPATAASRYRYALGKLRQMIATNSNEGIAHEVR